VTEQKRTSEYSKTDIKESVASGETHFFRIYDLTNARKQPYGIEPAPHQKKALKKLYEWHDSQPAPEAGCILTLPTGAGKTYTAIRFICGKILNDDYKVIWLAHTHHLLEQAFHSFEEGVEHISEPRRQLAVRVVSGTRGHYKPSDIKADDDVLIATLQTLSNAYKNRHPSLEEFIAGSKGRIFVVFDEAHHSPAPSYRKFISALREHCPDMYLLGLTATPTYTDDHGKNWLKKIFPQGIIHQVSPNELMAANILARPIYEEPKTNYAPELDEREYQKWINTYQDIPEEIITKLAENKERNILIAEIYCQNREKYGKTIIFADRWYQCEQISEFLKSRKITTGTVYSHIDADPGSVEARNRRTRDENSKVIDDFRKDKIDVLINVRMLTEGTDVPKVKTVFLTRQTRSRILMMQMVGRALRGTKFNGTPEAFIVSFVDDWKKYINWAEYDQLAEGLADDTVTEYGKKTPVHIISIELIKRLSRQMDSGCVISPVPFLSILPAGWFRVEYTVKVDGSEDFELKRELVLVNDIELDCFDKLIAHLLTIDLGRFEYEDLKSEEVTRELNEWVEMFFRESSHHCGSNLEDDILKIARHISQNGRAPRYYPFETRDIHDLDSTAIEVLDKKLNRYEEDDMLRSIYNRTDRLWVTLYYNYDMFKSHFDACMNRILHARRHGADPATHRPKFHTPDYEILQGSEPAEEIKRQIKERDSYKCLCCGNSNKRDLQIDHIVAKYYSGGNIQDNLQTLCSVCNMIKGIEKINFRDPQTDLTEPLHNFDISRFELPVIGEAKEPEFWENYIRRVINFFYKCGAVQKVTIGRRGDNYYHWKVELRVGNDPLWFKPHIETMFNGICQAKQSYKVTAPESITVSSPGLEAITIGTTIV